MTGLQRLFHLFQQGAHRGQIDPGSRRRRLGALEWRGLRQRLQRLPACLEHLADFRAIGFWQRFPRGRGVGRDRSDGQLGQELLACLDAGVVRRQRRQARFDLVQ